MSLIKICGLFRKEDIEFANIVKPDFVGFVFAPSKRQIDIEKALNFRKLLDKNIKVVGVFVNSEISEIELLYEQKIIDIVQLHGDENQDYIDNIKQFNLPVIKAIRVGKTLPTNEIKGFNSDFLLFDTLSSKARGGLGVAFDWSLLNGLKRDFFLAGGVNCENIDSALKLNPYVIDISSGVEKNGIKNLQLMMEITDKIRASKTK